mmetsp:Transcript_70069/g.187968  ORF Transcript_70069/g.187968 Transcript_70069/m.187968 type:complete len:125 (+) Transcript_70069:103-477(+)
MWTAWPVALLGLCAPAASFQVPMSSDEGPSFATFAFEHPPDVLHGATSESLYVEDSSVPDLADGASATPQRAATPTYPPGWGPTGPTGGGLPPPTGASATGDPHLQNVHGEKFDLMRLGGEKHT